MIASYRYANSFIRKRTRGKVARLLDNENGQLRRKKSKLVSSMVVQKIWHLFRIVAKAV